MPTAGFPSFIFYGFRYLPAASFNVPNIADVLLKHSEGKMYRRPKSNNDKAIMLYCAQ